MHGVQIGFPHLDLNNLQINMPKEKIESELIGHSGQGRVKLELIPANKVLSVPPGVSVFDAASWNGVAIDSTCGGHGTCKKCKVKITQGKVPISRLDIRAFSEKELNFYYSIINCLDLFAICLAYG